MVDYSPSDHPAVFRHLPGSRFEADRAGGIVYVPGSSGVVLDESLLRLWQRADGCTLAELHADSAFESAALPANLAALRVAGLLLPPLEFKPARSGELPPAAPSLVSVVIVSRNGRHQLEECLPSLLAQTYPRLEVIVVDDHSTDTTAQFLRESFPSVKVIQQIGGPNFAAGNNQGVREAKGELILLLNNDTVLDPFCVQELVAAQTGRAGVGGVAAMLRFYANRPFVNGLGAFVRRRQFGHDVAIGHLDVGQFDNVAQVPLLCFGAALIPRTVFDKVGLLDERYEFYYEDADWSYRARARGFDLVAAPRALVYHKFGASTGSLPSAFKMRLVTRNRLLFVLKNFPGRGLVPQLAWYGLDDLLRLGRYITQGHWALTRSVMRAWAEFVGDLPRSIRARRQLRTGRAPRPVVIDGLTDSWPPSMQGTRPRLMESTVNRQYQPYLARLTSGERTPRLLIISPDVVDVQMGGVGMRYWELARALAKAAHVILATPNQTSLAPETFEIRSYKQGSASTLKLLVEAADIVLLSGFSMYHHPFLREIPQYRVIDLYDPTILENLERFSARPLNEQNAFHATGVAAYNDLLDLGDFFICASEKQRDYWLGALSSANRVNPAAYADDPTLRRLIDVVPFGLQDDPPLHTQQVLKGRFPGIDKSDKVIVWGGGVWDWLDPLTAIDAMPAVLDRVPEARLFFMGIRHPNPDVPPSRMAQQAIERAAQLGLRDRAVFFNDWVPYALRANYLLESDIGISLHGDHIETRFSVRTRLMDYLWANLPMVVSGGDTLSDLVDAHGLGHVVEVGQVDEVARGIIDLLRNPIDRSRFQPVVDRFRWSHVAEPLARYVAAPWQNGARRAALAAPRTSVTPAMELPRKALAIVRERGPRGLLREMRSYMLWRWQRQ